MDKVLVLLIVLLIVFVGSVPVRAAEPAGREALDAAIDRALAYLQRTQDRDGAWQAAGTKSAAITGLSIMAFLSAGHVPGEGRYGPTVEKGIRWVLQNQQASGLIATQDRYQMYHHGICTLMLAQVAGMTDHKLADEVRQKLEKAVQVILRAQRGAGKNHGGWGYYVADDAYADISIAGWQLLSLRAAKNLGCDVPAASIDRAVLYVRNCWDRSTGGFFYQPGYRVSPGCTGSGILSLELCGKDRHRTAESLRAGDYLLANPPVWGGARFFYAVYYGSQASFQLGGRHWNGYRPHLHKALLPYQGRDGAWHGVSGEDATYGPNYGTAMTVLALTVEYRYLPIYQRDETAAEK
jgi:hypothetical protein